VKITELRALSKDELIAKERTLKEELFKLNLQRYSGRVEKPHQFKLLRKDIARIETLLNETQKPTRKEKKNG
jgi:large subunit ribosomal protein L29